ncbi:MAG: dihydroneopterin aldolase [Spirochaetaceae bacterium]
MRRATVGVRELEISCILGVNEEERSREQPVRISVEFDYDAQAASRRDDIREAINYDRVVSMVTEHLIWQKYKLMEAACGGILSMLRDAYPELLSITIEVAKPRAVAGAKESYCRMVCSLPGREQE